MCMSGGGGSGGSRNLRAGQLGVAQRGVATSTTEYIPGQMRSKRVRTGLFKKKTIRWQDPPTPVQVADPLQQVAVSDGAQARIKSRKARSGVANIQQNSRFGSRRPKTGSLRIDAAGAQVSGGGGVM